MYRIFALIIVPLLSGIFPVSAVVTEQELKAYSLTQLEQRLAEIDNELDQLAHYTLRSGMGNLGWLSKTHTSSTSVEWIEIQLGKETPIDQIVLVPILWNDAKQGPRADGFPLEFKIIAGGSSHPGGVTIASFSQKENLLPGLAPVVVPIKPTTATWVRIEATKLSDWAWEPETYVFQLSEVMIFNGSKNVALKKPVKTSSGKRNYVGKAMYKAALVDGFMPYLMDAATGNQSDPYVALFQKELAPSITIDLGEPIAIDGGVLHAVDLRENIPKIHHADYGLPKHLIVEGASQPDFSDAVRLFEYKRAQVYDAGPLIMRNFSKTTCRFVRLTALAAYAAPEAGGSWRCIGFAEIELLSNGKNVAQGKPATISIDVPISQGTLTSLTDGQNHFGHIHPIRAWVNQLARRHALERERPIIVSEINKRYTRQKTNLKILTWLSSVLATGILLTILIEQTMHRREVRRIKERFAADLHDELGANLHTIGLLSDMAEEAKSSPENLSDYLQRIRAVTERSGFAVRHVTDLNGSTELFTGLKTDMQRAAERIVDKLEHDLLIEGEEYLPKIKLRTRIDLFLFYKECLINICRHSEATQLSTLLIIKPKSISLSISDNGHGLPDSMKNGIPKSLARRARLLRAKVSVNNPPEGGTRVLLTLRPTWRFRLFKG